MSLNSIEPGRRAYENLKDEAADYIRTAIVSGELAGGSKIDQDEIADALGTSRAPVREALIELTQKGFVDSRPRRGAFVAELTATDIDDYYEVVASIFALTTRRAVSRLSAADTQELRRLHRQIAAADEVTRQRELARRFFNLIATTGRSPRLDALLTFIGGMFAGSFYLRTPAWPAHDAQYRERLLAAIESGDERLASEVTTEYLRDCGRLTIEHLRATGYWASAS